MCIGAYLVFPSVCSVLVYHRYVNANIPKQPNRLNGNPM